MRSGVKFLAETVKKRHLSWIFSTLGFVVALLSQSQLQTSLSGFQPYENPLFERSELCRFGLRLEISSEEHPPESFLVLFVGTKSTEKKSIFRLQRGKLKKSIFSYMRRWSDSFL